MGSIAAKIISNVLISPELYMCDVIQAELNEVLEDDEVDTPAPTPPAVTPPAPKATVSSHPASPAAPSGATGLESRLMERIEMYKTAISNAKAAGETSKVRRYDRGLKVNSGNLFNNLNTSSYSAFIQNF